MKFIVAVMGFLMFQGYVTDYEYIEKDYVCPSMDSCDVECLPYYESTDYADKFCRYEDCIFKDGLPDVCNISCSGAYYEKNMSWLVEPCLIVGDIE